MSNYGNFISDFPNKCLKILETQYSLAVDTDTEVTLMLNLAAGGFVMPYERLVKPKHPSRDNARNERQRTKFDDFCKRPFVGSKLCRQDHAWRYIDGYYPKREQLDSYIDRSSKLELVTVKELNTKYILCHLRNALAHGTIFTDTREKNIKSLIFLSNREYKSEDFNIVVCTVDDFHHFLHTWLQYWTWLFPHGVSAQAVKLR
jgi:hypothetical protein